MIAFYYVDKKYADYLRTHDRKVPNTDYETHRKFVCGVVLHVNGVKYYAPISHDTQKRQTSILIRDKGRPISSIKFCFMIPVVDSAIAKMDFKAIEQIDSQYASLLRTEYRFCLKNIDRIEEKALSVYKIGNNKNHALNKYCCDFLKLEAASKQYQL